MQMKSGDIIQLIKLNIPRENVIIKETLMEHTDLYSLGKGTDLGIQTYNYDRVIYVVDGKIEIVAVHPNGTRETWIVNANELFLMERNVPVGVRGLENSVVVRQTVVKREEVHPQIHLHTPISFNKLLPIKQDEMTKIILIDNPGIKVIMLGFDQHVGSMEYVIPGKSYITAIDGDGIVFLEDKPVSLTKGHTILVGPDTRHRFMAGNRPLKLFVQQKNI